MDDEGKSKQELLTELVGARQRIAELEASETQVRAVQAALNESEDRIRHLIESAPIGIRIAADARYSYVNPAFVKMFGYDKADEVLGRPVEDLFAPEDRNWIRKRLEQRAVGITIRHNYEATGIRRDGKSFPVDVWGTAIDYEGRLGSLAFLIDVTEAKSLRSQLIQSQKMEAIGTLAGGIAHDFNNILQVILGYSDMLRLDKRSPETRRADVKKIGDAARHGADLVRRLLTFSRRMEPSLRPVDLNARIQQVEQLLSRTIPRTIQIALRLEDNLETVNMDSSQIEQALINLALNARDAMPNGGLLTFSTENVTLDGEYCRSNLDARPGPHALLTVCDTGRGIHREHLERIFEPFFTTKPPGHGTGLGLAMVYGIVKQHRGHIRCHSEPGLGTTFEIYLPAVETTAEPSVQVDPEEPVGGPETLLLVDDEETIRDLGKRLLTWAGYTVLTASNGKEALEVFCDKQSEISLVILDVVMPKMDGKECLKELLKLKPDLKIILASGYAPETNGPHNWQARARAFVSKPFDSNGFLKIVRGILDEQAGDRCEAVT
ncbi:MAG: PAS domain S-box protein [Thermodesulfobacteriota bacterium]